MLTSSRGHDSKSAKSTGASEAEKATVSVLVVDDHPVVRMGVSMAIGPESGLKVIGEASSCAEAKDMLIRLRPDVVLMDLILEDGNACELMSTVQRGEFAGKIIVYTAHASEARVREALRAGASGYVIKGSTPERLIDAIHTVARGGSYLDPAIASQVMGRMGRANERRAPHSRELTERETTVLRALALGKRNKDIARELFITERTVKYHVNGLFTKLRVKNRTQAVRAAIDQGLISL
jgi:DNA-binding NarL/FixJ family response regulator